MTNCSSYTQPEVKMPTLLGRSFVVLATIFVAAMLDGVVLSILWGWFVVPVFGVSALGLVPAVGLSLVVGYLVTRSVTIRVREQEREEEPGSAQRIMAYTIAKFSQALVFLGVGWVVHQFM